MTAGTVPLIRRSHLDEHGWHSRRIRREVETGYLRAIRPGVYARGADVDGLTREEKIIVRARALDLVSATRPTFCGLTAAAMHGLPCLRDDGLLHVLTPDSRPSGAVGVVRHRNVAGHGRDVELDGIRCTPLARTVADVARTEARDVAVSIADAALRQRAFRPPGAYDVEEAARFREEALRWARLSTRGRRAAERALLLADGRAQLPGESLSRLRLLDLGFAPPSLQVPVAGPRGSTFWVDFGLDDVNAWGEFDGRAKYRGLASAAGRTPHRVIDDEKRREDWIRGTTQRRFARWGWEHVGDAATLGRRLAAFGITPP
ncbi:hypothetical protein [Microbacterium sp. 1P10AE]|uniref:hypothetical protein n=1 Tax=Microbacterium sp. 1P10AE TaxID=3132286 RepID=UPI0039A3CC7C